MTPWIFCDQSFCENAPLDQPGKDSQGDFIQTSDAPVKYITLGDIFPTFAKGHSAFYIDEFKGYTFVSFGKDPKTNTPIVYTNLCQNPDHYASTCGPQIPNVLGLAVTFGTLSKFVQSCSQGFDPQAGSAHSHPLLATAISSDGYPTPTRPGIYLDKFMPISATFYHELYHLTDGNVRRIDTKLLRELTRHVFLNFRGLLLDVSLFEQLLSPSQVPHPRCFSPIYDYHCPV